MLSEKTKNALKSILKLTRFGNLLIIVLAQYFTAGFLVTTWSELILNIHFFLLCSSTVLIAAAGYIINDYYDVKIDFVNKPDRVVIGKNITRRFAILYHVIFSSLGILIGLYLSWRVAAVNVFSVFLLWLYSNNLKRQPFIGNLSVAFLTGLSIYVVEVFFRTGNSFVIIYASFSFFMTLVREIIKDMEDLKGDNIFGCRTLPIVLGIRKTKMIIYGILAMLALTVLLLNEFYTGLPLYYFILFLFIPLIWLLTRLIRADTTKDYAWLSNFCKIIMLLGILSMAFV
ncbi:MAG TPA: geranylgeranylglycerol-phosphate geranylgeranyltransferase [Cyclobacteriaceae bacterium]